MPEISKASLPRIAVACVLCVCWLAAPGYAQSYVNVENPYIGVSVGVSGTWDLSISHSQISGQPLAGRFNIYRINGDPTTPDDDASDLIWQPFIAASGAPGDKWAAIQIMVDGFNDEGFHMWAPFEEGGLYSGIWGSETDGSWEVSPHIRTDKHHLIYASWYPVSNDDAMNTAGGYIPILCEQSVRLMHDMVRFEWTLTNQDYVDHYVGLRLYADTVLDDTMLDGGTDLGQNIVSVPGLPLIEDQTLLSGSAEIPGVIEMFNSQRDPFRTIRFMFSGSGATAPDKVGIDEWTTLCSDAWSYQDDPNRPADGLFGWPYAPIEHHFIDGDLAFGAFWKAKRVSPGQSRKIVHYIGLASSSLDMAKPSESNIQYCAAVQGPRCLKYYTEGGSQKVYPDPFTITAYLENLERTLDFQNASFTLMLPAGLALDESENNHYTKTLTSVNARTEASVSWKVKTTGNPRGILNYSVAFSAYPAVGTTVTRSVNIPATSTQPAAWRWQMVSVPFEISNADPVAALGLQGERGDGPNNRKDWCLISYDPTLPLAQRFDWDFQEVEAGKGYYLWLALPDTISLTEGDYTVRDWVGNQGMQIPLAQGWNMIGNPFVYAITVGELRFYHRSYGVLDFDEAVQHGLISRSIFAWNTTFQRWDLSTRRTAQLKPWQGYWLKVYKPDIVMLITPASQIEASIGGTPPIDDGGGGGPPTP